MSEEEKVKRRDPLSAFLMAAAILLAIMYGVETWGTSTLEGQTLAAGQLGATMNLPGCHIGAAGQKGEVLVLRCAANVSLDVIKEALDSKELRESLAHFESLEIHRQDARLSCPLDIHDWSENCRDHSSSSWES